MSESDAALKQMVGDAVTEALGKHNADSCLLGIDREKHEEEHRTLRALKEMLDRVDNLKWGFLGTLGKGVAWFLLAVIGLGIITWLKLELSKG